MNRAPKTRLGRQFDRVWAFVRFLWKRFRDDKCFETAGALSFTTLFAIVPLLAAVFAVLSVVPAFADLRGYIGEFIFQHFVPAAGRAVQGYLLQFADNASRLTIFGALVLAATALLMMASIEDRFNRIWRVPSQRKGSSRFLLYWAALTLGPVLVVVGVTISSWLVAQPLLRDAGMHDVFGLRLVAVLPSVVTFIALMLLYVLVPNCRVRWRHAVIGALVGALLFEAARKGFASYVQGVASYREVYGALAAVPIFLIWIFLAWVIVLLGASLTAALAAFEYRHADDLLPPRCEFVGLLRVVQHFVAAQREGRELDEAGLIASERFLTADLLQRYLLDLQRAGVIRRVDGGAWAMVRAVDGLSVGDLYRAGDYRLPADAAALQRAISNLSPEGQRALLQAEAALRGHLAVPLRTVLRKPAPAGAAPAGETPK